LFFHFFSNTNEPTTQNRIRIQQGKESSHFVIATHARREEEKLPEDDAAQSEPNHEKHRCAHQQRER